MNFKSRKHSMTTLTFEEVQDKTFLKDLHEQTRQKLESQGVKELLPV